MKITRLLIILAAFLIMISSVVAITSMASRTIVYVNIGAMATLVAAITCMNFGNKKGQNRR